VPKQGSARPSLHHFVSLARVGGKLMIAEKIWEIYFYLNGHHHHHHHYQSSGSHRYCIQALEACHLGDHLHIQKKYVSRVSSAGLNGNAISDFPTEIP